MHYDAHVHLQCTNVCGHICAKYNNYSADIDTFVVHSQYSVQYKVHIYKYTCNNAQLLLHFSVLYCIILNCFMYSSTKDFRYYTLYMCTIIYMYDYHDFETVQNI